MLKCKSFAKLSTLVSPDSSGQTVSTRSSMARRNSIVQTQENATTSKNERSLRSRKRNHKNVHSSDEDGDDFVDTKKKAPRKRRSNNVRGSTDDTVVDTKKQTPKKRRSRQNVVDDEDFVDTKKRTPNKRRKPLLTIKCNKITDYYKKAAKGQELGQEEGKGFILYLLH